jgi:hypothetical protein
MTNQAHRPTHQELIAAHRTRYMQHALAALEGLKEFKLRDDCGVSYRPVDHAFIDGMDSHMPAPVDRIALCDRIVKGQPVPHLDCVLSGYVVRLTGKPAS